MCVAVNLTLIILKHLLLKKGPIIPLRVKIELSLIIVRIRIIIMNIRSRLIKKEIILWRLKFIKKIIKK